MQELKQKRANLIEELRKTNDPMRQYLIKMAIDNLEEEMSFINK